MSTLVSQPAPRPSWKEEVNQRLAAHKRRSASAGSEPAPAVTPSVASTRAAEAAARVAARYAKAPSFSEMQAAEARAALRAAEAATRAALEAQAAAQAALDSFEESRREEASSAASAQRIAAPPQSQPSPDHAAASDEALHPRLHVLWEPDLPLHPAPVPAQQQSAAQDADIEDSVREVEPAQPIPANLIQFPRELVATRRVRPRAPGSRSGNHEEASGQLSIFEVDPSTISIDPPGAVPQTIEPLPAWTGPEWPGIELDDPPQAPVAAVEHAATLLSGHELAPLQLRLIANLVDASLILGIVTGIAALAARELPHLPGIRASEMAAMAAILLTTALYNAGSFVLAGITPGMRFAGIALCTFDNEVPTRAQLRARLGAMLISLLPLGLGAAWAIFDEDHLCWHNRLSRTYLRECAGALLENPPES
ncbi:MAG: RDD family protein [Terracidiphilus sp.]